LAFLQLIVYENGIGQSIQDDHQANRTSSIENLSFDDQIIHFNALRPGSAFVVIHSKHPLQIVTHKQLEVKLNPGWDGTLGYSLYGLALKFSQPGPYEVELSIACPPDTPGTNTKMETEDFIFKLNNRESKIPQNVKGFTDWQLAYKDSLSSRLMGNLPKNQMPAEFKKIYDIEYEKFNLLKFEYPSRNNRTSTALLSIPKGIKNAPLLLALHGHETTWAIADSAAYRYGHVDDFCAYFANRGWAVLQPATMDHSLQSGEKTLQGQWTADAINALSLAESFKEVDMNKVAVCGLSTGGHLAMNLLALDDRIKAGVVGCILSTWNHYEKRFRIPPHCDCGIYDQLSPLFEQCDWAALAAPKPVMFQHGKLDAAFCPGADSNLLDLKWNTAILPKQEYDAQFEEINRAYNLLDAEENVITFYHKGPHSINNEAAYEWLMCAFQLP
jgi:dienelactone hydrolase